VIDQADAEGTEQEQDQQEDIVVDILTGKELKPSEKEELLQRMIRVLAGEYHFPLECMERDFAIPVTTDGRKRSKTADLVVFTADQPHTREQARRLVVVQPQAVKPSDATRGIELLKDLLDAVSSCEFGLWTNGKDIAYLRKRAGLFESSFEELSDFPGMGETLEELDRPDRRIARVAVAEDLRDTVLRCHDYLYGNQGMMAPKAFGELVKLIFCKIVDEQQLRASTSYRRQFWVGVAERNDAAGQQAIAERITVLFGQVKHARELQEVFRPGDELELEPRHLAWVASELARYQFLDAEVDIKGMAYEAMVATTMKRERGQFFTPRNVVEAMVSILAPQPGERVLDPAMGSARFLVACLDRFRHERALSDGFATEAVLRRRRNSKEILGEAAAYARECLFGIDFDPELLRAAKMNMLINNDGHGNLVAANSLELTATELNERKFGDVDIRFGSFDVVLTNPPFGAKIPIDDPKVLRAFDLGHRWRKSSAGEWVKQEGAVRPKMPPEILFIERCMQFLKEGGRMGIVVPDGILGNPDNEPIRAWILQNARVLACIDLPVEAFLPQVGVQASLLFLQKKTTAELNAGVDDDYPIFMAVAEFIGHDRRGVATFRRDPDGYELTEEYSVELPVFKDGRETIQERKLRRKKVADDLPIIVERYSQWKRSVLEVYSEREVSGVALGRSQ
jgi:type I restriction enzyme M protein